MAILMLIQEGTMKPSKKVLYKLTKDHMTIKEILEHIDTLASEDMTEDGIHHDDWADHEGEYKIEIIKRLSEALEYTPEDTPGDTSDYVVPFYQETMDNLNKLTILK